MKEKMKQLKEYVKTHKKEIIITATGALVVVGAGFGLHKIFSEDTTVNPKVINMDKLGPIGKLIEQERVSKHEYAYYPEPGVRTYTVSDLGEIGLRLVEEYPENHSLTDEITGLLIMTK